MTITDDGLASRTDAAELLIKEARRLRRRRWMKRAAVLGAIALLASVVTAVTIGQGRTVVPPNSLRFPTRGPSGLPREALTDWRYVAEGPVGYERGAVTLHVYSLTGSMTVEPLRFHQPAQQQLEAVGRFVVGIAELPRHGGSSQGEAYSVAIGGSSQRTWQLGPANEVLPAVGRGVVWLETFAQHSPSWLSVPLNRCTLRKVTLQGKDLSRLFGFPCSRSIVAAVPGGLLSFPHQEGHPQPLQVWSPETYRVVRTITNHAIYPVGVSADYVAWQTTGFKGVYLTSTRTWRTLHFRFPVPVGYELLSQPESNVSLSPSGPYLAGLYGSPELVRALRRRADIIGPCCIQPGAEGHAVLAVFNAVTGKKVIERPVTAYAGTQLYWAGDGLIVLDHDVTSMDVVPLWGTSLPIGRFGTEVRDGLADDQQGVVVSVG
jgi:hypothetical protein